MYTCMCCMCCVCCMRVDWGVYGNDQIEIEIEANVIRSRIECPIGRGTRPDQTRTR